MTDEHGRIIALDPPEPWKAAGQRLLGYYNTCKTKLGNYVAHIEGHIGSTDWRWAVQSTRAWQPVFESANGGGDMTEGEAQQAALAVLATAVYIDSI